MWERDRERERDEESGRDLQTWVRWREGECEYSSKS